MVVREARVVGRVVLLSEGSRYSWQHSWKGASQGCPKDPATPEHLMYVIIVHFVHKTTYGPLIYTALYVMLLMQSNPLLGQVGGGWALHCNENHIYVFFSGNCAASVVFSLNKQVVPNRHLQYNHREIIHIKENPANNSNSRRALDNPLCMYYFSMGTGNQTFQNHLQYIHCMYEDNN
jgi:hypothetical protein